MVQGGMSVVKYLLFFFNFIFVVTGIAFISVGAIAKDKGNLYLDFLGAEYASPAILLIIVGVVVFILAFFGCCGAIKENYCMLSTFSVLLFLIFILGLAGGITAYVYRGKIEDTIDNNMHDELKKFANSTKDKLPIVWDEIQANLKCCGITNATDWYGVKGFNETNMPLSCCAKAADHCNTTDEEFHHDGCLQKLISDIEKNVLAVGGVGIGIAFIELLGIVLACCLAHAIKKEYEVV